ncbi:MAG: hypothetical protein ACR2HY_07820 [Acidimicrobiales bacterium]
MRRRYPQPWSTALTTGALVAFIALVALALRVSGHMGEVGLLELLKRVLDRK